MTGPRRSRYSWALLTPRLTVVALALMTFGLVGLVLAPTLATTRAPRKPPVAQAARPHRTRRASRVASPVGAVGLAHADAAARSFLVSYLRAAYGRAPVSSIIGATPALRALLSRGRVSVTPAEHERHPRAVSVEVAAQAPGFVLVTAVISDGGITRYSLRLVVEEAAGGWVVTRLIGG